MPLFLGMRLPVEWGRLLLLSGSFCEVLELVEVWPPPARTIRYLQPVAPQAFLLINRVHATVASPAPQVVQNRKLRESLFTTAIRRVYNSAPKKEAA